ncbi:MAG: cytochrome c [Acidobacteriia bacterium]|nr:cytochrome c [Terriglobia bacterium]
MARKVEDRGLERAARNRATTASRAAAVNERLLIVLTLSVLGLAGCRQDMHDQPKYIPLRPSSFFADGRSERPLIAGTVARGHLDEDSAFYTGKGPDGKFIDPFPFPVTKDVVLRGQQRFNIYCTPCHDRSGNGLGMVVRRGFRHPPSYHIDRLRQVPNGYIFDVITNGFGAMPTYAAQIQPADRWAIVSYIRALQLSQTASINDVPPEARNQLGQGGTR